MIIVHSLHDMILQLLLKTFRSVMEPRVENYEFTASSALSQQQLEVLRLFNMCGVNPSNEKFQVILI